MKALKKMTGTMNRTLVIGVSVHTMRMRMRMN
jgi:hypothetical protein